MPDGSSLPEIKISQLPVGTAANLTDMVEVSQTDPGPVLVSRSVTVAQVATAVVGTLPAPPTIPTTLPPSGPAGGDLAGSYPNPTIKPSATNGQVLTTVGGVSTWAAPSGGGGSGTVTSTSVVSANGLAGTVATPTTTPAITLSTTITGMLKGNGTAISAGVAGTDYMTPANVSAAYLPTAGGSMAAGAAIGWTGKSQISSPADGNFLLANNAGTAFGTLQLGGTTNAFPGLFRSGNALSVVLADGSNYATLNANNFNTQNGLFFGTFGSITSPGIDGQFEFFNNAGTAASRLDIATDGTIKFRNRTNSADAITTFATQPTAQNDNSGATTAFVKAQGYAVGSIPTSLPPNGAAGGALNGTYPNPGIAPSGTNGFVLTTVGGVATWAAAGSAPGSTGGQTFLAADVALNATGTVFNIVNTGSIGAAGQVFDIEISASCYNPSAAGVFDVGIHDGTSYLVATRIAPTTGNRMQVTLPLRVTLAAATTYTLRAQDASSAASVIAASAGSPFGLTSHATSIRWTRVA